MCSRKFRFFLFAAVFTLFFASCTKEESAAPANFSVYYKAEVPSGYSQTITFIQGIGVKSTINNAGTWISSEDHPVALRSGDSVLLDVKATPLKNGKAPETDSIRLAIRTVSPDRQTEKTVSKAASRDSSGALSARIAVRLP
ncbi:MAG: hypothetical protein INR69_11570 [Mucilaginibacter polytrichastri]|nr:hypothetical protein [Mucilaginibacter polytrichastri]